MIFNAEPPAVIHFLTQFLSISGWDAHSLIDHDPGHALPLAPHDSNRFLVIQEKSHLPQFFPHQINDFPAVKIAGKGHIIAVAGIGNASGIAPSANGIIKVPHNDIGNHRGTGRSLR